MAAGRYYAVEGFTTLRLPKNPEGLCCRSRFTTARTTRLAPVGTFSTLRKCAGHSVQIATGNRVLRDSVACSCRKVHPCWSGGWSVFVDDAARAAGSSARQRLERGGPGQAHVRPVAVVVELVSAQNLEEMFVVPDQGAVQEFAADGSDPTFHDRVHARGPYVAQYGADASVSQDGIEGGGEVGATIADQELDFHGLVFEFHEHVASHLRGPVAGRVQGGAQDADPAAGVLDDGQNEDLGAVQQVGVEEVGGQDPLGLGPQEVGPGDRATSGCRVDAGVLEDLPDSGGRDDDTEADQPRRGSAGSPIPDSGEPGVEPGS